MPRVMDTQRQSIADRVVAASRLGVPRRSECTWKGSRASGLVRSDTVVQKDGVRFKTLARNVVVAGK